jgi:membrane protease YdiL (CAAX protease family)
MWKHPGVWTFAACWLLAAACLLWNGQEAIVLPYGASLLPLAAFVALTTWITEPPPPAEPIDSERVRLWIQVALVLLVAVVTGWSALTTHEGTANGPMVPGWSQIVHTGGRLAQHLGVPYNWGANPLRYCFLPALFLLPLTGWKYLGLSRGALQTRLQMLIGPIWGIVLASLLFGVWHLGLGFITTGKDSIAEGLASTIVVQGTMGLCFGVIYYRTRNLLACSVVHVMHNTVFG